MMAPDSRFGTVPFTMVRRSGSEAPDWVPDLRVAEFHITGGNRTEVQVLGQGRMKLTVLLRVGCERDYVALMNAVGTERTLIMPYTGTAFPGDRDGQELDVLYKALDNVLLTIPQGTHPRRNRNGTVHIEVQFSREVPS